MLEMIRTFRRDLHRIPEIMFDLPKTRAYILDVLKNTCARVEITGQGGILAFFDAGADSTVAFRADMDALSITEQTGVDYASCHPGRMHACGHDAHMAMLLTLCMWLTEHINEMKSNVLAIFQPAEESGGGAEQMAESGALERLNVKTIYAFHVDPMHPAGAIVTRPGAFMAKSSEVHIVVHGRASHVAEWQKGVDSLEACADLYLSLLKMERSMPADVPRLLKFGQLQSGTAVNIISERTELHGTMRAFSMETFGWMKAQAERLAAECEKQFGVQVELTILAGYPPLVNDENVYEKAKAALAGFDFRLMEEPELLSEDFSFFLQHAPGMMMKLGVGGGMRLHSSNLIFDEEPLLTGVRAMIRLAQEG